MRRAFVRALTEIARLDERVLLFTGDLGYSVVEPFAEQFPDRFFNVGVAEQNMVGLATGAAEAGFIPFCYSIATFASLRPFEFIRNGPALHRLPVRIVGVGGGFEYGPAGPTHHAMEDLGAMRLLPQMAVIAPADHQQAVSALWAAWDLPGPAYLRLGKDEHAAVPGLDGRFELGRAQVVRRGAHALLVTTGAIAAEVMHAADDLSAVGTECEVMVVASVSPAPVDDLSAALGRFRTAVTVEAHSVVGGLGSLVCEVVAEQAIDCRVVRCGIRAPAERGGSEAYLNEVHGLSRSAIAAEVSRALWEVTV